MKKALSKILIVVLALSSTVFLDGCQKKCPKPEKNIPGTSTFRTDCPYKDESSANTQHELNMYVIYDNTDDFREQLQAFQSANPNVKVNIKKFVNLEEYQKQIVNEIAEGEGPDVFMAHNSWVAPNYKKLLPMSMDLPVVVTPEQFRQGFFQAAQDDLILDEKIYGMPLALDNLAVYYNKSYFKDLLATTDRPGALWENIKDQVFQLTKQNNSPERFALSGIGIGRADNVSAAVDTLYTMMLQSGVQFYNEKGDSANFANDSSSTGTVINPGTDALTLYTSFGLPSYKNYSWNDTITGYSPEQKEAGAFVRGKVAMILGYPYLYNNLVQAIQNQQRTGGEHIDITDIGVAPMPQLVSPSEATKLDTLASYFPLVVSRTTKYPQDAWNLAIYLATKDSIQTYHKKTNRPTSRRDLVQEQVTEPLFGVFAQQAPYAKSFKVYDETAYNKIFADAIQDVINNTSSPKQAMTEAQTKITCIVQKYNGIGNSDTDCGI